MIKEKGLNFPKSAGSYKYNQISPKSAINIKQEELKVDPNSEVQQQSSAIYNNATCSQFTTQFNQFYENNGVHHGGAEGASNQIDHVTSGLRQSGNGNVNNNDDGSALIPVTSSTNNQGSFVQTSPGISTCAGIISATGEEFPINHQNLVDHKGEPESILYTLGPKMFGVGGLTCL